MILFFTNIIGFIKAHWRAIALGLGAFLLLLVIIIGFRSCGQHSPTIDEKEIQKRQDEIEKRESEKLNNTLQKSNEVLGNASNAVKSAEANTKEATNKDFTNTSLSESEKARCRAYPSRCPK